MHDIVRAHAAGVSYLGLALDHGDHVATHGLRDVYEHKADRAASDNGDGVTDFNSGFVKTAQHAGQRFDHGSFFKTDVGRDNKRVQVDDAARDADVFGICAVVEQQVFAEIFLMA
jgi:hypothetical protein